jgi:NMD protein affecting ribosome stability and mRNA decay
MIIERTYHPSELHHGVCSYCGDESDEITEEGLCVDCVVAELFYQETMKDL